MSVTALAQSQVEDPRAAALAESTTLIAQGRYGEALPYAQSYLELTEGMRGRTDELAVAHLNLGETQLHLQDYAAAEQNIRAALTIIEATHGIVSRTLIRPLALTADLYTAQQRYSDAAASLTQAITLIRRTDGLFSLNQLPLVASLVEVQKAAGDENGVERELRFAILATKQELGPEHPDTLEAVRQLADWYQYTEQYDMALFHYGQIVDSFSASEAFDTSPEVLLHALIGVTRSHRLQYANDPKSLEATASTVDPRTGKSTPLLATQQRVTMITPARGGENGALNALKILDSRPEPPRDLLFETLVEIGDWYITDRQLQAAAPFYARAWALLDEDDSRRATLSEPRVLVYRPPRAAERSRRRWEGAIAPREIDFTLTVREDGATADIETISLDAPPGQIGQIRRALEFAIFSPRIDDGRPVTTRGYRFTERWYEPDSSALQHSGNAVVAGNRL